MSPMSPGWTKDEMAEGVSVEPDLQAFENT